MCESELSLNTHLENISYFVDYTYLSDAKEQLLTILNAAMYSEFTNDIGAKRRGDMVYFYRLLLSLIESIHWLAIPILEKFEYKELSELKKGQNECPHCHNKIELEHD